MNFTLTKNMLDLQNIKESDLDLSSFTCFSDTNYSDLANLLFDVNMLEHSHQDYNYSVLNCDPDGILLSHEVTSDRTVTWEVGDTPLDVAKKIYKLFN